MQNACVDTNIWFYALAKPVIGDDNKHQIARKLISRLDSPFITPQIINELTFNLLRKRVWSEAMLRALIADLRKRCRLLVPNADWHERASIIRERYTLAFWDSLILAAIEFTECEILFSEDMQHNLKVGSITIINPFNGELNAY